jgi:putative SOS response-associated peptidase YedK
VRRFVQALSSGSGLPDSLPAGVRHALVQLPDRYNLSVRQPAGVLLAIDDLWHVGRLLWGLIPSWEPEPSTRYSTQTARLERAPRSRMYRRAWAERRCLVPITGFYKWDRDSKPRQPYFVQAADGAVLFAAGLWECWRDKRVEAAEPATGTAGAAGASDEPVYSFTVLTHPTAAMPAPLFPDGPVFLPPATFDDWVSTDPRRALRLALRAPAPVLEAYPVSRRVANRQLDDYALLEPADPREPALDVTDPDEYDDD